ncbi:MAG: NADH-quinone oxidoreductase subunit N [Deltaproteobacteria bacterium]|nr:NADH-quinone oxidoreductase subunit N [Deltaproteobacteria bacterium]MBW2308643.1 NADH-quinone oxidoreductase subunit N [Deltaproteobacteria bacterium]
MNLAIPSVNIMVLAPELILTATALIILIVGAFFTRGYEGGLSYFALFGVVMAAVVSTQLWGREEMAFSNMWARDRFSLFFDYIIFITTALTILMSISYLKREGIDRAEYYALVLFAAVGMMIMAGGADLIVIFMGLETLSIAIYVLAGFLRKELRSNEASLKYFLLGAFSSAFLLYGIALTLGATGSTNLKVIAGFLSTHTMLANITMTVAIALLIVGFGFKVASVPFHMWTPDVYEGAPTSVTAFMSVGVKAAAFAAFVRVFLYAFPSLAVNYTGILWVLAVLTMTLGNVVAIAQTNIKRMLAYSSIAHAGYLLVAMVAASEFGTTSILYYILAYAFMNLGAFGVIINYGRRGEENLNIDDYSGMGSKYPLLAAAMAIFMFSLAGIPPTAGFVGKFYIFSAAVKAGYVGLAIIGVLNSAVSVYYYLNVTVKIYMKEPIREIRLISSPAMTVAIAVAVAGVMAIGIYPSPCLQLARQAVKMLI